MDHHKSKYVDSFQPGSRFAVNYFCAYTEEIATEQAISSQNASQNVKILQMRYLRSYRSDQTVNTKLGPTTALRGCINITHTV